MPIIRSIISQMIADEIIDVQPIVGPTGQIFTVKILGGTGNSYVVQHISENSFHINISTTDTEKFTQVFEFINRTENTMEENVVTFKSATIAMEFKLRFC